MGSDVGVRFTPTDEEIIDHLKKKRLDPDYSVDAVREIDLYKFEPWELPGLQSKEKVRFFFCEPKYMDRKKSERQHRKTDKGCWKSNGQGSKMKADNSREVIGTKRTLSFRHNGVSNKGNSEWVLHEISVKDDPLYKKDFVVCRVERKGNTKLGISTSAEEQSSQDLASGLSTDVTEDIFSESAIPTYQLMVSDRNHVAENIFSKTDNLISLSGNQVAGNTSLEYVDQQLISDRNHVAEDTILVSQPNQHLVAANTSQLESISSANQHLCFDRNHIVENTYPESQLLPSQHMASQLLARQHMASYSRNYVAEIASPESQRLANQNLLSWNTPLEYIQAPNQHLVAENTSQLESISPPNQHLFFDRNHVVENTYPESQLLSSHSLASYPRNYTAFDSQRQASQHMASYSRNHVAEIASSESQQLANHDLLSYYRNHVAEISSTELQLVSNDNLESLIQPNPYIVEAEPQLLAEFNPHGGYNGLNYTSFSALQSPIYLEQELSYPNDSSYGCDLLNSPYYSEWVDYLINSPRAFQNESFHEETGQAFTPDFNSSKSDECSREATGQTFSPNFNSSVRWSLCGEYQ